MSKKLTATKLLAPALAASLLLAGCADKAEEGAAVIDVKADDTTCELGSTETSTGSTTFNVTNSGTKINEFYVMTSGGRILGDCLLYTSPSPRDLSTSRMPSSA